MSFAAAERRAGEGAGAAASVVASLALHVGIVAAFLALRPPPPPQSPPFYKVNLVAAAPSPAPSAGVVKSEPVTPPPEAKKAPPRPKTEEVAPVPVETKTVPVERRATPSTSDTRVARSQPDAPVAGGGDQGATGADVASVRIDGIDFPFPGYLDNIVRQIRLRFQPPRSATPYRAEVFFLIRRNGCATAIQFRRKSGSFTFDLEAQGAIEAAAKEAADGSCQSAFGPLPAAFTDDVLPVMFSFDPRLIR